MRIGDTTETVEERISHIAPFMCVAHLFFHTFKRFGAVRLWNCQRFEHTEHLLCRGTSLKMIIIYTLDQCASVTHFPVIWQSVEVEQELVWTLFRISIQLRKLLGILLGKPRTILCAVDAYAVAVRAVVGAP